MTIRSRSTCFRMRSSIPSRGDCLGRYVSNRLKAFFRSFKYPRFTASMSFSRATTSSRYHVQYFSIQRLFLNSDKVGFKRRGQAAILKDLAVESDPLRIYDVVKYRSKLMRWRSVSLRIASTLLNALSSKRTCEAKISGDAFSCRKAP